ncbi:MAG: hypothetical protein OXN27_09940 [Candidatus Poribacteria bacterium]|nr:hypothetical protein [Candidatus Poribacteria bacterium]MDE0324227.1 hypothetical protein [Candidatus Poribacteria bacterium]
MEIAAIIVLGILACTWMSMSYAKKAAGLEKGASQREIEVLQEQVSHIQEEMVALKTEVKRLIQIAKGIDE